MLASVVLAMSGLARAQEPAPSATHGAAPAGDTGAPDAPSSEAETEAAELDLARQLFEEGLVMVERADWAQAEQRFRRVLAVRSSPVVAYNLASALFHLGRLVESAELLRVVVRDPSVGIEISEPARQLLAQIEPKIGSLTVRLHGDHAGVSLRLDERLVGEGVPVHALSVDPGEHHVQAEREGATLAAQRVTIGGGAPLKVEITLELPTAQEQPVVARAVVPKRDPRVAPDPASEEEGLFESPWLWVGAGAVVATAATVVVVALASSGDEAEPIAGDTNPPFISGRVMEP